MESTAPRRMFNVGSISKFLIGTLSQSHLLFIKAKNGELSIASYSFEASLPIAFLLLDLEGGQTTIFVSTTTGLLF
ncbi:hypothetical protein BLNAU_23081 [Blattamonas nauphoetae]|nr:hypothetical protein BLNAU_23081 [Blattamonas nauphoetae]